jgi:hypothetical protein
MKSTQAERWIHLDCKGMLPSEERLCQWLTWFREHGFEGVVFEYEDRLPWAAWPGVFRPGWPLEVWRRIWAHCAALELEVTPLIQTCGHLEWLLQADSLAHLRCAGHGNLLCPSHPETRPRLEAWIAETARLHPQSRFLHVGLDEVYHLGACSACQEASAASKHGATGLLLEHAHFVCETVRKAGKEPILWSDMFVDPAVREALPEGAIVCDWDYRPSKDAPPGRLIHPLARPAMGASAIRCSFSPWQMLPDLDARLSNIRAWQKLAVEVNGSGGGLRTLIHTVWGRSRSLAPLYGPWEGWLPAFLAAGEPGVEFSSELEEGLACLREGLSTEALSVAAAFRRLGGVRSVDPWEEQALRWWELSLRHRLELCAVEGVTFGREALRPTFARRGVDANIMAEQVAGESAFSNRLNTLEHEVAEWLSRNQWSDAAEYLESRFGNLRHVLAGQPPFALNHD